MRTVPVLFVFAVAAFLAFAIWYSRQHPRVIVATGKVQVTSARAPFGSITLTTRDVEINGVRFREVELVRLPACAIPPARCAGSNAPRC